MIILLLHLEIYHYMKYNRKIVQTKTQKNKYQKMKAKIKTILQLRNFFRIVDTNGHIIRYNIEKPGQLLIQNIYTNWLRFLNTKTSKHMKLFSSEEYFREIKNVTLPVGYLNCKVPDFNNNNITMEYNLSECSHVNDSRLYCNILVPKQDVMQYFIQWQRYRKFWWSSITTTPSLFAVNDIKYREDSAEVDIIAQYPWGKQIVETVQISHRQVAKHSCLNCAISLEGALLYILQDALTTQNKEEYLRLHRKMAPYKISFALKYGGSREEKDTLALQELAQLLHIRLNMQKISTFLPDWSLPSESQIKENLHMGVTYTAVLSRQTLENGIFHLLNSSTMLQEEVHVADFDDYATVLFSI